MKEYKYEDIFEEDPNDPDNVLMTIPPEILEAKGWGEGTRIKIMVGDKGSLILSDVEDDDGKE